MHTVLSSIAVIVLVSYVLIVLYAPLFSAQQENKRKNIAILLDSSFSMSAKDV
jgi:uncharacterized membrane protein YadS